MKKIVPFKKEIPFDNNIAEIVSVSLEHSLKFKDEKSISGDFIVEGSYKLNETSINTDHFKYNLPFKISIDKKYETKDVTIDINNFYYEVINNKILLVDIEVVLDNLEEIELTEIEPPKKETETIEEKEEIEKRCTEEENSKNVFGNVSTNEVYDTYKIYIIREHDTLESILEHYKITVADLEEYNDISEIKVGNKLIIPKNNEQSK